MDEWNLMDNRGKNTRVSDKNSVYGNGGIKKGVHKFMLTNRKNCVISGVIDVLSFDLSIILLETDQGMLSIKGNDLHVNRLSLEKGEVDIDGRIDSLEYGENGHMSGKNESFLGKLFR